MSDTNTFLEQAQETLSETMKPHQKQVKHQQQMLDSIRLCVRYASKNDFLQLDHLLNDKLIESIEQEPELEGCLTTLNGLREYAAEQMQRYRVDFLDDVKAYAQEVELPFEIDFPRFKILEGIEGEFDFSGRQTTINQKKIKSIDPQRIVREAQKFKKQLYDRPYDPQNFIDTLYQTYQKMLKAEKKAVGDSFPIQKFYLEYVLSLQSKAFFQNMDKGKFKGYSVEQFGVDLWCYFQAGLRGAQGKYAITLRPGRNNALWLIDTDGERRQITTLSFQENK